MNCPEFLERLQRHLDGEAAATNALAMTEHRLHCVSCRQQHEAARQMLEGLKRQPILMPPPGMAERIAARILSTRRSHIHQRRFAIAASFLVAAIGLWAAATLLDARRQGDRADEFARLRIAEATPDRSLALRNRLTEVRTLTLNATRQVVQETVSTASALVPSADLFPMPPLPAPIETSLAPFREVGNTVAVGMEPVANTAIRAWDTLRKEFMSVGNE